MWIRLKCRAGWLLRLKFSVNLLAEIVSLHQDDGGRSVSSQRQHREQGISEMRLRMAGFFLGGREAGFATPHFFKSSCCKNYFLFSCRVFCKDYKHCREQHWSMACFWCSFEGWKSPFSVPYKAGSASLFSPQRPEGLLLSYSELEWWLH